MTQKRFLILTLGSQGDVQPHVALGLGLRDAGHAVTLCWQTHAEQGVATAVHYLEQAARPAHHHG